MIACCLLDASQFDNVSGIITADTFGDPTCSAAFCLLREFRDAGKPADAVLLATPLAERVGTSEDLIGQWLLNVLERVPHSYHAADYARQMLEVSQRRESVHVAMHLAEQAANRSIEVAQAIATAEAALRDIAETGQGDGPVAMDTVLLQALDQLAEGQTVRWETGFTGFDQLTGGFRPGQLVVIGARPAMGKTALALTLSQNLAESGNGVLFVSLEMSRLELAERMLSRTSMIGLSELRSGAVLSDSTRDRVMQSAAMLEKLPLTIDDRSHSLQQIAAAVRMVRRRRKIAVVVVDYLQLVSPEDARAPREQQVSQVSRRLKQLAREQDVTIVALSQLNRMVESRQVKRPQLSDLRESGAIEQDADVVMFLHRPAYYGDTDKPDDLAELIVAKQRNGSLGTVDLTWIGNRTTFANRVTGHGAFDDH